MRENIKKNGIALKKYWNCLSLCIAQVVPVLFLKCGNVAHFTACENPETSDFDIFHILTSLERSKKICFIFNWNISFIKSSDLLHQAVRHNQRGRANYLDLILKWLTILLASFLSLLFYLTKIYRNTLGNDLKSSRNNDTEFILDEEHHSH